MLDNKENAKKSEAFELWCYRRMLKVSWKVGTNRLAIFHRFPIPDFRHEILPIPDTIRLIGIVSFQGIILTCLGVFSHIVQTWGFFWIARDSQSGNTGNGFTLYTLNLIN